MGARLFVVLESTLEPIIGVGRSRSTSAVKFTSLITVCNDNVKDNNKISWARLHIRYKGESKGL